MYTRWKGSLLLKHSWRNKARNEQKLKLVWIFPSLENRFTSSLVLLYREGFFRRKWWEPPNKSAFISIFLPFAHNNVSKWFWQTWNIRHEIKTKLKCIFLPIQFYTCSPRRLFCWCFFDFIFWALLSIKRAVWWLVKPLQTTKMIIRIIKHNRTHTYGDRNLEKLSWRFGVWEHNDLPFFEYLFWSFRETTDLWGWGRRFASEIIDKILSL